MFHLAGILCGRLLIDAERHEEIGQYLVAVIDVGGDRHTGFGKGDEAVLVHFDITVLAELLHRHADTGFGEIHFGCDVDGSNLSDALSEPQDCL